MTEKESKQLTETQSLARLASGTFDILPLTSVPIVGETIEILGPYDVSTKKRVIGKLLLAVAMNGALTIEFSEDGETWGVGDFWTSPIDNTLPTMTRLQNYLPLDADELDAVSDFLDFTTEEPESPTDEEDVLPLHDEVRYINTVTGTSSETSQEMVANRIYEWDDTTSAWLETIPVEGNWTEVDSDPYIHTDEEWVLLTEDADYFYLPIDVEVMAPFIRVRVRNSDTNGGGDNTFLLILKGKVS